MGAFSSHLVPATLLAASVSLAAIPQAPVVSSLGPLDGAARVEVSPDGTRAAAAFPPAPDNDRSTIRIVSTGATPRSIEVPGSVRSLLFDPSGAPLFAVQHRAVRKRPVESMLLRIDLGTLKTVQKVTVPITAASIDLTAGREAVLVACTDEVRTFVLPDLKSGPLYRLPGENVAIASIPGSARVLVGRPNEIVVIDLRSQQQRDGIPILARVPVPGLVADLVVVAGGEDALARLSDGRTFLVRIEGMSIEEIDPTSYLIRTRAAEAPSLVAEPLPPPPAPPSAPPAPAKEGEKARLPEVAAAGVAGTTAGAAAASPSAPPPPPPPPKAIEQAAPVPPPAPPEPEPPAPVEQKPVEQAAPETTPPAPVEEKPIEQAAPETAPPAPAEQKPVELPPPPQPPPPPPPAPAPQVEATPPQETGQASIRGRVTGDAASQVVAIVLFGPDSVIKEAARVTPDASGAFVFENVAPGRYRIVPDGGGRKALVSEPSFVTVVVTPGTAVEAPELRILRAL